MLHKVFELEDEERTEKLQWEYWLHRVYDQSFTEWHDSIGQVQSQEAPASVLRDAVKFTMSMSAFDPKEGD